MIVPIVLIPTLQGFNPGAKLNPDEYMSTLLPASPRHKTESGSGRRREAVSSSTQARSRGEEKFCTVRGGRLGMQARGSATHGVLGMFWSLQLFAMQGVFLVSSLGESDSS